MSKAKVERRHCVINPFKPHPMWNHRPEQKLAVQVSIIEGGAQLYPNGTVKYHEKLYPSLRAFRSVYVDCRDSERGLQASNGHVQGSSGAEFQVPEEEPPAVDKLLKFYEDTLKESYDMIENDWNILDDEDRKIVLETKAEMIQLRDARILELAEIAKGPKLPVEPKVNEWEMLDDIDSSDEDSCCGLESGPPKASLRIPIEMHDQSSQDTIGTEESRDSGCQLTEEPKCSSLAVEEVLAPAVPATPVPEDMEVDEEEPMANFEDMEVEESQMETSTLGQTVVMKKMVDEGSSSVAGEQNGLETEVTSEGKNEERQETCVPSANGLDKTAIMFLVEAKVEESLTPEVLESKVQQDTSSATVVEQNDQLELRETEATAEIEGKNSKCVEATAVVVDKTEVVEAPVSVVSEVSSGPCSDHLAAKQVEDEFYDEEKLVSDSEAVKMETDDSRMFFETSSLDRTVVMKKIVEQGTSPVATVPGEQSMAEVNSEAKIEKMDQVLEAPVPTAHEVANRVRFDHPPADQAQNKIILPANLVVSNLPDDNQPAAVALVTDQKNDKRSKPQVLYSTEVKSEDQLQDFLKPKQPKRKVSKLPTKLRVPPSTRTLRSCKRHTSGTEVTIVYEKPTAEPEKKASTALPLSSPPPEMAPMKEENCNESNGKEPVEPKILGSGTAPKTACKRRVSVSDTKLEVLLRRAQLEDVKPAESNINNLANSPTSPNKFLQTLMPPPANVAKSSMSSPAVWNFEKVRNYYTPSNAFPITVAPVYKRCLPPSNGGSCTPTAARSSSAPRVAQAADGTPSHSKNLP